MKQPPELQEFKKHGAIVLVHFELMLKQQALVLQRLLDVIVPLCQKHLAKEHSIKLFRKSGDWKFTSNDAKITTDGAMEHFHRNLDSDLRYSIKAVRAKFG